MGTSATPARGGPVFLVVVTLVVAVLGAVVVVGLALVALFAAVTVVALAFATVVALALVVALVAFAVLAGVFVTVVSLAFVVALAVILVAFAEAALDGAVFFGCTPFLAAEVTFFTAMPGPFEMALRHPHETPRRVREDKAIRLSSQWRNAATALVSPEPTPESVAGQAGSQSGESTVVVCSPPAHLPAA